MLASILFSILVAATSALAGPIELSNAERLQQGLPVKAPARRFDPSRTNHLHARASMGPTPQTQGSSYVQVTRVNPSSKRQMTTAGYLSYDSARSVFQVGSAGAAVGFATPRVYNDRMGIQLSSAGLTGENICANTQAAGPNGQPYAGSFTVKSNPSPSDDYGAFSCFIWFSNSFTGALTARYLQTRVDYVFTVDPTTSDLVAWTGATATVPPMADRVTLKVVHDPIDQPAVAPGGSYNAILRMSNFGSPDYNYMQWREMASWQAYFYPGPQSEATVFTVTPSSSDPSQLQLQFTYQNVLKTVAIAVGDNFSCSPDTGSCQASTQLTATPSNFDSQTYPKTYLTNVFMYPSTIQGADGLIAHIEATGTGNGQPMTKVFDIGFHAPGTNIATYQIDPTGRFGKYSSTVTVDIVPV